MYERKDALAAGHGKLSSRKKEKKKKNVKIASGLSFG